MNQRMEPKARADVAGSRMSFDLVGDSVGGRGVPRPLAARNGPDTARDEHSTRVYGELPRQG